MKDERTEKQEQNESRNGRARNEEQRNEIVENFLEKMRERNVK